ncbi:uncharacterized protein VTP21DRAFT_8656 [Calcarisporiella thermophila]|uniref:uncharacterized protein n=1 Tax=Calcarisporiella thermophila TaxID=911321 RepID=UPI0037449254
MLNNPLVWIDCEMTGLDIDRDHIIEIAVLITDGDLNLVQDEKTGEVAELSLIIHQPKSVMDNMNAWCIEHHGKSGLTGAVLSSTLTTQDAEDQVLDFIKQYIPQPRIALLAGNSVHADRQFLQKELPRVVEHLHYRIVDVSTVKELVRRWLPKLYDQVPPKKEGHRALDDIRESIEELRYYREHAFVRNG